MPTFSTLLLFAAAALALLVVPGPAVIYVVARSIHHGRAGGFASVLGIATGSAVHVVAAVLGLSAVLATSAEGFAVVKLLGATYLIWLGIRQLLGRGTQIRAQAPVPTSFGRVYRQGVVVQILNPKAALFFLAFLPQFVESGRGPIAVQVLLLGVLFIGLSICSDGGYSLLASAVRARLRRHQRWMRLGERASGAIYIGLGVAAALSRQGREATG